MARNEKGVRPGYEHSATSSTPSLINFRFKDEYPAPDWEHWKKMAYWSNAECACLVTGIDPIRNDVKFPMTINAQGAAQETATHRAYQILRDMSPGQAEKLKRPASKSAASLRFEWQGQIRYLQKKKFPISMDAASLLTAPIKKNTPQKKLLKL